MRFCAAASRRTVLRGLGEIAAVMRKLSDSFVGKEVFARLAARGARRRPPRI